MAGGKSNNTKPTQEQAEELVRVLSGFLDAVGNVDLAKLNGDVQSLTFDNERIVKPALKDIREILGRDVYASKTQVADLKQEITDLKKQIDDDKIAYTKALEDEKKRTKNYELVEKVVFGLVGIVLLSVGTAMVALVIITGGK